jgi:endogenous inhibitor of DNA gyrase (YacG/DUF329 family)
MIKVRCPICNEEMAGRTADWPDFPFCSPRCRKIDLGRWLGGRYRIPGEEAPDDESSPSEDTTDPVS